MDEHSSKMPRRGFVVAGIGFLVLMLALGLAFARRSSDGAPGIAKAPASPASTAQRSASAPRPPESASTVQQGFLYGRVTTPDDAVYEGRLRFGGDEEAFWNDSFKGYKAKNPWAALVPPEQLRETAPFSLFGLEIVRRERQVDLSRPFMARFGDIARIEAVGRVISVTLKSGSAMELDRFNADDLMDGLRVWDAEQGVVALEERRIRRIDLLPTLPTGLLAEAPTRLMGRVATEQGDFGGAVTWDWGKNVDTDTLRGESDGGERSIPFESIRSIEQAADNAALVKLSNSEEITLSGSRETGQGNRGLYVDDPRYGRVLIGWNVFERIDFNADGSRSGPAYADFPPGEPLQGKVLMRDGRTLAGRLVFDLDESETTETLDAPDAFIHYTIPFGLVASVEIDGVGEHDDGTGRDGQRVAVTLHNGELLSLERDGDLGEGNAGLLVFVGGSEPPDYLPWAEVARIDFERPEQMYPPVD